jgi:hypothetical protein
MRAVASRSVRWLVSAVIIAGGEHGLESRGAAPPQERPDIRIFAGTSPPVPKSEAVLALDMDAHRVGFSSGDSVLGQVQIDVTPASFWRLFPGAGDTPDRVVFEVRRGALLIRGDVLLEAYDRAVVDVVSAAKRIRYLLTPSCTCLACLFPSLSNPDAETSGIGPVDPGTPTDGSDIGILTTSRSTTSSALPRTKTRRRTTTSSRCSRSSRTGRT